MLGMGKMILEKSFKELLKEEQDNLLAEINEKAKRRISLANPDTYSDGPRFRNTTYKKRHSLTSDNYK